MNHLGPRARQYISDRIDYHTGEIEATVLQDRVFEADDGAPEALYHLANAAEAAHYTLGDRELSEPVHSSAATAFDEAKGALEAYIDELVAKECLHVIQHADEWAKEWDRDPEDFEAAKKEARGWLQQHADAAKRIGAFEKPNNSDTEADR